MLTTRRQLESALRVYLVADPEQTIGDVLASVRDALASGVTMVQLRAKSLTDRQIVELGRTMHAHCQRHGAAFLVNDRVDLALAIGADGVHLGVDDLPIADARKLVPSGFVLGFSPDTDDQAENAARLGASYLGVGPVFGTSSKSDAGAAIGLELLTHRAEISGLPTIGIGGVTAESAASVIKAGACGVSIIGAILRSANPGHAAAKLRAAVDDALMQRDA
jgi:thiamine-phosphate pyrophosphorylase